MSAAVNGYDKKSAQLPFALKDVRERAKTP